MCLGLILVALQPVQAAAQNISVDGVHSLVLNPGDTLQPEKRGGFLPEWHAAITNIPGDWLRFAGIAFRSRYAPLMAGTAGLTVALVAVDDAAWRRSHEWYTGSETVKDLSDKVEFLGDGRPQFGLAAAFAFVSTRPGGRWDLFPNQIDYAKHVPHYDAYPSGHVTTLLATVTVVIENYPEWWWARPVGYAAVAGLAISMGNTGIHWYSDYSFGMIAAHPLELGGLEGESKPGRPELSVAPLIEPSKAGIVVSVSF